MTEIAEYKDLFFRYEPETGRYHIMEKILGITLGYFYLEAGPGWVFITPRAVCFMGELPAIAEFYNDLLSFRDGEDE